MKHVKKILAFFIIVFLSFAYSVTPSGFSITSVEGDNEAPYFDTINNNQTTVNFNVSDATACRWDSSDKDYETMANNCSSTNQCIFTGVTTEGTKNFYIACISADGNYNTASDNMDVSFGVDWTKPSLASAFNPASGSTITTNSPTITFNTSENADCRWSLEDYEYDAMSGDCTGDGTTAQSCETSGLSEGSETVYFACKDIAGNKNSASDNYEASYTVITVDTTPPTTSLVSVAGDSSSPYWDTVDDSVTTITVNGEEGMACRYGTTDAVYSAMTNDCSIIGSSASCIISLAQGNYTYYISCKDSNNNEQSTSQNIDVSFGVDWTKPSKVTGTSATAQSSSSIKITWSAVSESDLDYYKIYRNDSFVSIVDEGTTEYLDTGLSSSTTYSYKVGAVDDAGLEGEKSDQSSATTNTAITPSAPSISSNMPNDAWGNSNDPNFTWNSVDNATGYSCAFNDNSSYSLDTSIDSECDRDITYNDRSNGTYYFHLRACNGSNCSEIVRYTVKIDATKPTTPENFSVSKKSSGRLLLWDDSSDSGGSGVDHYVIYRGINCSIATKIATVDFGENEYTDTYKPAENKTYCYKITAVDKAGNESEAAEKSGIVVEGSGSSGSTSGCSLSLKSEPDAFIGVGEVKITISSGGKKMYDVSENSWIYGIKTIDPKITGNDSNKVLTYYIEKSYEGEELKLDFYALDSEDNQCLLQKMYKIDGTKPTISIESPTANAVLKGIAKLSAKAEDKTAGIAEVNFYYKESNVWKLIAKASLKDGTYVADWNTVPLDNGSYEIKGEAKDKAGNTAEATINVKLQNEKMQMQFVCTYKKSELSGLFGVFGFGQEIIDEAVQLINQCNVTRNVLLKQEGTKYKVEVEIKAKNNTGDEANIQIIEKIPKEIAESASLIQSKTSFEVIEEDPVIKFMFYGVKEGEEIDVRYTVNKTMTEEEAKKLAESNPASSFDVPPLMLYGETDISKVSETGNSLTGFVSLIGSSSGIIIGLLAIAAIAIVAFFVYGKLSDEKNDDSVKYYYDESLSDKISSLLGGKNGRRR